MSSSQYTELAQHSQSQSLWTNVKRYPALDDPAWKAYFASAESATGKQNIARLWLHELAKSQSNSWEGWRHWYLDTQRFKEWMITIAPYLSEDFFVEDNLPGAAYKLSQFFGKGADGCDNFVATLWFGRIEDKLAAARDLVGKDFYFFEDEDRVQLLTRLWDLYETPDIHLPLSVQSYMAWSALSSTMDGIEVLAPDYPILFRWCQLGSFAYGRTMSLKTETFLREEFLPGQPDAMTVYAICRFFAEKLADMPLEFLKFTPGVPDRRLSQDNVYQALRHWLPKWSAEWEIAHSLGLSVWDAMTSILQKIGAPDVGQGVRLPELVSGERQ